jgi:DNA-binding MurR/RpiR family transcriptional regulator
MIAEVCNNKEGRNLNCHRFGGRLGVSKATAHRMLKKNGFRSVKESAKPGN